MFGYKHIRYLLGVIVLYLLCIITLQPFDTLVGQQERHSAYKQFCFETPCDVMAVNVSGWGDVAMKSFGLSCEDAQNQDDCRLKVKWLLANSGLSGKWPLKQFVCLSSLL